MGANNQAPIDGLDGLSLQELQIMAQAAPIALRNRLQKSLNSENFEEVMKAQAFIAEQQKQHGRRAPQPEIKSILWNPSEIGFNGKGYRDPNNGIAFGTLNRKGDIFIIKAIINTRIEQVQNFLKYSVDDQKPGYQIRYKRSPGSEGSDEKELSAKRQEDCRLHSSFP